MEGARPAGTTTDAKGEPQAAVSAPYSRYVLIVLLIVYTLNTADRSVVSVLQEPLKRDFGWADWQLGMLGGASFGIFYSVLGIPMARLSERVSRKWVIATSAALWSLMTALCGTASSFGALFAFRMGVGVGEAGCTPPAHSIISSYFPARRRAGAIAVYSLGVTLGPLLAAFGGAWLLHHWGWRQLFFALGIPGIVMAIVMALTVREPARLQPAGDARLGFRPALRMLWAKPSYRNVIYGQAISSFVNAGVSQFLASFFVRAHHLPLQQAVFIFGIGNGVFATLGILLSGLLCNRLIDRHPSIEATLSGLGLLLCIPCYLIAYTVGPLMIAIPMLLVGLMFQFMYAPATHALVQSVADPRSRATAIAVLLLVANFVGFIFGPPIMGALSDTMSALILAARGLPSAPCRAAARLTHPDCVAASGDGLRIAILCFELLMLWPALHFLRAGRTLASDRWRGSEPEIQSV